MATPIEYNATADMKPTIVDTKLRLVAGLAETLRGDADLLATSFKATEQLTNVVNSLQEMLNAVDAIPTSHVVQDSITPESFPDGYERWCNEQDRQYVRDSEAEMDRRWQAGEGSR